MTRRELARRAPACPEVYTAGAFRRHSQRLLPPGAGSRACAPGSSGAPRTGRRRCGRRGCRGRCAHDRVAGDALAAQHLHAAIDHAPYRLGARSPWRGSTRRAAARPGRAPRRCARSPAARSCRSISLSASMKPTPSCSTSGLPKAWRRRGVVGGDVVRAPRRAEPAHAVRQPRRRQPHLRVAEALAELAEDVGRPARAGPRTRTTAWPPVKQRVHVSIVRSMRMPGRSMSARNMVARPSSMLRHDDREARAIGAGDEPLAAVDHPVVAVLPAVVCSIDGSEPAPGSRLGHAEARSGSRPRTSGAASAPSAPASRPLPAGACCLRRARGCSAPPGRAANSRPPRTPPPWRRGEAEAADSVEACGVSSPARRARRPVRAARSRRSMRRPARVRSSGITWSAMNSRMRACNALSSEHSSKSIVASVDWDEMQAA